MKKQSPLTPDSRTFNSVEGVKGPPGFLFPKYVYDGYFSVSER
jgi:hypothetical protein